METVLLVSDIISFMEVNDFYKMNFSWWFTLRKFSHFLRLLCCIVRNFSWKTLEEINVNVKRFLLWHITDFELVLHLKNSKKFKLNLTLIFSKIDQVLFFPCILNIHLEKLTGFHLDLHFFTFLKYLEKLIHHFQWVDIIWIPWFPIHDFHMVLFS